MQYLVKNYYFDRTDKKTSNEIPSTKINEEIVAEDAERFFKEIVKNTQSANPKTKEKPQEEEGKQ